jgi:hypothetical protein
MNWPDSAAYAEAIQNPLGCLVDRGLRRCRAELDDAGMPRAWSGAVADVYHLRGPRPGDDWAVKCFTREVLDRDDRYAALTAHLDRRGLPPFLVDFAYQPRGILIGGERFPVLRMRWVEGIPLRAYVERTLDAPRKLLGLAALWPEVARRLWHDRIAHGDLQHGNVLLVRQRGGKRLLKLVDYDGMWVPGLDGLPNDERGHPSYQHPSREDAGGSSPRVDHFSLLVIATALRALALEGRPLWEAFNHEDGLLFRRDDFVRPDQSELLDRLWRSPDPGVQALAGHLAWATRQPLDGIPRLDQIVSRQGEVASLSRAASATARAILGGNLSGRSASVFEPAAPAGDPAPIGTAPHGWRFTGAARVALGGAIGLSVLGLVILAARPRTPDLELPGADGPAAPTRVADAAAAPGIPAPAPARDEAAQPAHEAAPVAVAANAEAAEAAPEPVPPPVALARGDGLRAGLVAGLEPVAGGRGVGARRGMAQQAPEFRGFAHDEPIPDTESRPAPRPAPAPAPPVAEPDPIAVPPEIEIASRAKAEVELEMARSLEKRRQPDDAVRYYREAFAYDPEGETGKAAVLRLSELDPDTPLPEQKYVTYREQSQFGEVLARRRARYAQAQLRRQMTAQALAPIIQQGIQGAAAQAQADYRNALRLFGR